MRDRQRFRWLTVRTISAPCRTPDDTPRTNYSLAIQPDSSSPPRSSPPLSRARPASSLLPTSTLPTLPTSRRRSEAQTLRSSPFPSSLAYVSRSRSSPNLLKPPSHGLTLASSQPNGVEKLHPIGALSAYEKELLQAVLGELPGSITSTLPFIPPPPSRPSRVLTSSSFLAHRGSQLHPDPQALTCFPHHLLSFRRLHSSHILHRFHTSSHRITEGSTVDSPPLPLRFSPSPSPSVRVFGFSFPLLASFLVRFRANQSSFTPSRPCCSSRTDLVARRVILQAAGESCRLDLRRVRAPLHLDLRNARLSTSPS